MNMLVCEISRVRRKVSAFLLPSSGESLISASYVCRAPASEAISASQIPHHVTALVDIGRSPGRSLAVDQVRPDAAHREERALVGGVPSVALFGMLLDHPSDHLEMAELLERDVVQHVADRRVLDMEGLRPVGQRGAELASSAAELLHHPPADTRLGALDLDVVH